MTPEEAEDRISRLSRELLRAQDELFAAQSALRSVLDDRVGKRPWWPHPLLGALSDSALLKEIERRGLARWQELVKDRRAETVAEAILSDIEARTGVGS